MQTKSWRIRLNLQIRALETLSGAVRGRPAMINPRLVVGGCFGLVWFGSVWFGFSTEILGFSFFVFLRRRGGDE